MKSYIHNTMLYKLFFTDFFLRKSKKKFSFSNRYLCNEMQSYSYIDIDSLQTHAHIQTHRNFAQILHYVFSVCVCLHLFLILISLRLISFQFQFNLIPFI